MGARTGVAAPPTCPPHTLRAHCHQCCAWRDLRRAKGATSKEGSCSARPYMKTDSSTRATPSRKNALGHCGGR